MSETLAAGGAAGVDAGLLKRQLRRHEGRRKATAVLLVLPVVLYLAFNFVLPVGAILFKSIDDRAVGAVLARTSEAIAEWDGKDIPGESVFAALVADLREARAQKTVHVPAKRLNSAKAGFNALLRQTARRLPAEDPLSFKDALIAMDAKWGETVYWSAIKRTATPITPTYLLAAFDLTIDEHGRIVGAPEYMRIFNDIWLRTFWMGLVITMLCVAMGYPLAYVLANLPSSVSNLLMILVLLPFWTAGLVRTIAWIVLLQNEGVINDVGLHLGLWTERVQLIYNRFGVYVAMSYILLPYIVLPVYATMKRISPDYMRAAKSLGANPIVAFLRVYLPLTLHGVGVGALFVFILAVGFYITPLLVGGPKDQMVSFFIAFYTSESLNWGAAAALSTLLLLFTVMLYFVLDWGFGISKLRMQR